MDADKQLGILDNTYSLINLTGKGGTSKVYIGYNQKDPNRTMLAIKIYKQNFTFYEHVQNEIDIQQNLNIRNIVKLVSHGKGVFQKSKGNEKYVAYIVLEYMEYGDLFDFIALPGRGFGESMGRRIFMDLLNALEDMHSENICHRDIKTENILLDSRFQVKLADFSFAASTLDDPLFTSFYGTYEYNSPELLDYQPYVGTANDIFSLGVTLFIIVLGKKPFKLASEDDFLYDMIIHHSYDAYWEKILKNVNNAVSDGFKALFISMVAYDHKSRPSISEIKNCSWVKETTGSDDVEYYDEFRQRARVVEKKKRIESKL
jgi:serine/threonine protein kinase